MRERQPRNEARDRLLRRAAVERHEGRWSAGGAYEIGAPPVPQGRRDLDCVASPVDRFFEVVDGHDVDVDVVRGG